MEQAAKNKHRPTLKVSKENEHLSPHMKDVVSAVYVRTLTPEEAEKQFNDWLALRKKG